MMSLLTKHRQGDKTSHNVFLSACKEWNGLQHDKKKKKKQNNQPKHPKPHKNSNYILMQDTDY